MSKFWSVVVCGVLAFSIGACAGRFAVRVLTARNPAQAALEKSVRVISECEGQVVKFGSGVAVGAHEALTARHVVTLPGCETPGFTVLSSDGTMRRGRVDWLPQDGDVARLRVGGVEFPVWATSFAPAEVGDHLTVCAGQLAYVDDPGGSFFCKEVTAGAATTWRGRAGIYVGGHVVPGNSGAGVFDERGRLVGIFDAGLWDPEAEFVGIVTVDLSGAL